MSNFNFKQTAQEKTALCRLMAGREQLKTEDVLDKDYTIIAFDFAPNVERETGELVVNKETGEVETHGVLVFKEMPGHYYSVGTIFTKVCDAWAAAFTSPQEASEALAAQGGVKVRFKAGKTKRGNPCTQVDILD